MAGIYKMTQRELSALLSAAGQHGLYGFAEVLPAESKEREGCEDALLERHYLRDGGQQGKQLEDGLGLLIVKQIMAAHGGEAVIGRSMYGGFSGKLILPMQESM